MWKFRVNYCVIVFSRSRECLAWSQKCIEYVPHAVNLLQLIETRNTQHITASRSKFFFSRSSVRPHPFKNFLHPFDCIHSKIFVIRLSARPHPFKHFRHPFIHSAVPLRMAWLSISHPFACRTFACLAFVRKERFVWEVTFDNLEFGKINYCFGESLDFWVQKSVRTLRVVSSSNPFKIGDKLPFWPKKVKRV